MELLAVLGAGGNTTTVALELILMNNGDTGGTGLNGILRVLLDLNLTQLVEVRVIGKIALGRAETQEGDR